MRIYAHPVSWDIAVQVSPKKFHMFTVWSTQFGNSKSFRYFEWVDASEKFFIDCKWILIHEEKS